MDNSEYWRSREEKQRAKNIKNEKEYDNKIKEIYQNMMDEIQKEIDSFYAKYAKDENITMAEAKKRASKLDIEAYARKAKKYVQEKNFSKQANEEMKLYNLTMKVNRLELLKANIALALVSGHDDLDKYMNKLLENRASDELKRQAGILGDTIVNNAEMAHSIVNASFHNATYSDRIWMHQDLLKHDLDKLLAIGLIQGRNPNELARELRKKINVKISDAQRLMRTELARVQIDAQMRQYRANDIDEFEYIACGLGDVCDTCLSLDGKIFKVKNMQAGENAPPMHPNCHCSTAPHMDDKEYQDWLSFIEMGGTTKEWRSLRRIFEREASKNVSYKKSIVNKNMLNSSEFRRKFDTLTDDKDINRKIYYAAKQILTHRSGTKYEDLVYINSATGEILLSNKKDIEFSCKPSKNMTNLLQETPDYSIIGIHNHPGSSAPSVDDIIVAGYRKYKFGLVVCHDGTLYKYFVESKEEYDNVLIKVTLDDLEINGYTKDVKDMLNKLGVQVEVV